MRMVACGQAIAHFLHPVHFFVSLPFTAAYSYATVLALDGAVQGRLSTTFRSTTLWTVIGLAVGGSLAIALGSAGRVPDQSQPRLREPAPPAPASEWVPPPEISVALLQIEF